MSADVQANVQTLRATPGLSIQLAGAMLASVWTDLAPPDNDTTLDLAQATEAAALSTGR
jgi:hypothetical protein